VSSHAGEVKRLWTASLNGTLPPYFVVQYLLFSGVYLVGNVNPERVDFKWALLGSYITLLLLMTESGNYLICLPKQGR
jgi:hypothetical protein